MIAELRNVSSILGSDSFTMLEFNKHSSMHPETIRRKFGSWRKAMEGAGLQVSKLGRRYSDDEYFENLLNVWTYYGRQPKYEEMNIPPSQISSGAYENKWGTWTKALLAFIKKVNSDTPNTKPTTNIVKMHKPEPTVKSKMSGKRNRTRKATPGLRSISLGLRYKVLSRDNFRCVRCGTSPATDITCKLHVDHKLPISAGGLTTFDNLQTLCFKCNIGKSNKVESSEPQNTS